MKAALAPILLILMALALTLGVLGILFTAAIHEPLTTGLQTLLEATK